MIPVSRTLAATLTLTAMLGGLAWSAVQDKPAASRPVAADPFDQLKKLAGEWSGTASFEDGQAAPTTVTYRVTSAGSAVIETLFPGTDHEMITMFHRHGKELLLTHYCAAGNQPRMKAERSDNPRKIVFKYLDGTNLDPAKDMHMHDATIEFVDADHIKSEWISYRDGKPLGPARFDLKRRTAGASN